MVWDAVGTLYVNPAPCQLVWEDNERWPKCPRLCYPCGRPGWRTWFFSWPSPDCSQKFEEWIDIYTGLHLHLHHHHPVFFHLPSAYRLRKAMPDRNNHTQRPVWQGTDVNEPQNRFSSSNLIFRDCSWLINSVQPYKRPWTRPPS